MSDTKIYTILINGVEKSISNIEELYKVLNQLQNKVAELQNKNIDTGNLSKRIEAIKRLSEGVDLSQIVKPIQLVEEEIDRLSRKKVTIKADNIERTARDIKSAFRDVKVKVDTTELKKPFNVVINGKLTGFSSITETVEKLKGELSRLTIEGKLYTPEFATALKQLVLYLNTINKTNLMVDKLVGGSMTKMVKLMQSLSGLGSIAGGLQGLFGNTALDETMLKFASLSLIMQGLALIEKELALESSLLNKIFTALPNGIKQVVGFLQGLEEEFSVKTDALRDPMFAELIDNWNDIIVRFKESVKDIPNTDFGKIFAFEDVNPAEVFIELELAIDNALSDKNIDKFKELNEIWEDLLSAWVNISSEDFSIGTKDVSALELIAKYREEWENTGKIVEVEISTVSKNIAILKKSLQSLINTPVGKFITNIVTSLASLGVSMLVIQALGKVVEWVSNKFEEWQNKAKDVVDNIKTIVEVNKLLQTLLSKDTSITTIERLNKQYQELLKTLKDILKEASKINILPTKLTDESRAAAPGIPTFTMLPKAVIEYSDEEKQLKSFVTEFNKLDLSKVNSLTDNFFKKWTTRENITLIKNSGKYIGESLGNAINDSFNAALDIYNQLKDTTKQLEEEAKLTSRTISANNIAAIKDEGKRRLAEIENNRKNEIADAEGNAELIASINNKYDALRLLAIKENGNKLRSIQELITLNQIDIMEDGLAKELALLNLNKLKEIAAAGNAKLIVSINNKYNKLEEEAKKKHYRDLLNLALDYEDKMRLVNNVILANEREIAELSIEDSEDLATLKANNAKRLLLKEDAYQDEYETAYQAVKKEIALEESKDKKNLELIEAYYNELESLTKLRDARINKAKSDARKVDENNTQAYIDRLIAKYSEVPSSDTIGYRSDGKGGLVKKTTNSISDLKSLNEAISKLRTNLQNIKNDPEFYNVADYLKNVDAIDKADKELAKKLADNNQEIQDIMVERVEVFIDTTNTILDLIFSISENIILNLLDKVNKEIEIAELEISILEESYSKLEELTNNHLNKMDEIEDELAESRGDRREHLIDQLNAEREAYLANMAALQESQAKQDQLEAKKERLLKKQEKLLKKQKKLQQALNIASTIMNTATAVMQAYATFPYPLSAVVGGIISALGAVLVATIAALKFADGGLVKGASHSNGGVQIEAEGGEYIINKLTTAANLPLLEYINKQKDLITIPERTDNRPIYVSVVDINNALSRVRNVQVLAGDLEKKVSSVRD